MTFIRAIRDMAQFIACVGKSDGGNAPELPEVWGMRRMMVTLLGLTFSFCSLEGRAQDVDVCPAGWKAPVQSHLVAVAEGRLDDAAAFLLNEEQEPWLEWQRWNAAKLDRTLAAMSEALRERHAEEERRKRDRLEVSVYSCEARGGDNADAYRVRVDPDGRSFRVLNVRHDAREGWRLETRHVALDAEQRRMITAYLQALDELRWDEAEAWVAASAIPRFKGYRLEVENYLRASEFLMTSRKEMAENRQSEWPGVMLWAEKETDDILVVHAEFLTSPSLACEMVREGGTWRILHR